jgi:hypothetical protein
MTTPDRILAIARSQLGTAESPNGSNPYGRAYGMDRVAWCMQFCWWVFREAGASNLIHPKTAYTPTAAQWFRERGRLDRNPRVGDLVFFNWPDSVNRIQHVGIVEAVERDAIITIEGNTSTTNQSDGGRVMRRRRARNSSISGYGHPAYTVPARPVATPARVFPPPRVRKDDVVFIKTQPDKSKPVVLTALLSGPMFVALGPTETPSDQQIREMGSAVLWVEYGTWQEFDRRSHALCDNPRPVQVVASDTPGQS